MTTGQTVTIKLSEEAEPNKAYPWEGIEVPVKIIGEYQKFFVGTVLPHRNPKGMGVSSPYNITIRKQDIEAGTLIITEEETK